MEYPDYMARFYDLIYNKIRSDVDHKYFLKKISETEGPVLEIGVGTGRFYCEALSNNADIYGIDISRSMVDVLLTKIDKKFHNRIFIQDVSNFKINKKFDLIIAPFRVFSHIIEVKDQIKSLNNINEHLSENGLFIFDLFVPNLNMLVEGLHNHLDFEGEYEPGKKIKRIVNMKSDHINQINHVYMKFIWDENAQIKEKEWYFPFRIYHRFEIEHLVNHSKLKLEKIYGDYLENDLVSDSKEFVITCRKA